MHAQCAWCQKDLGFRPSIAHHAHDVTHGICPECADYFFTQRDHSMHAFLNRLDAPVVLVDSDVNVIDANDAAVAMLGQPAEALAHKRGGDVLECANAKLPQGCGHTVHCLACSIRNCVRETAETGRSLSHVPAWLRRHNESAHPASSRVRLEISTERLGGAVLLRIDDAGAARASLTRHAPDQPLITH